jgi:uncharacterized protein (DUF1684 family)
MKRSIYFVLILVCSLVKAQEVQESSAEFQQKLNKEFANKEESPLTDNDFKTFKELDFFPISEQYIVQARFVRTKNEKVFKMKTSTTRQPEYIKYGELHFMLEQKKMVLNVYQNVELSKKEGYEDYLFLPFSDQTCGKESYLGGRYIDLRFPQSETVIIDFNKAYNPYCAYNHKYSCPVVPLENDLPIEIKAGVKKFHE